MEQLIKKIKHSVQEKVGKTRNSKMHIAAHVPPGDMTSLSTQYSEDTNLFILQHLLPSTAQEQ